MGIVEIIKFLRKSTIFLIIDEVGKLVFDCLYQLWLGLDDGSRKLIDIKIKIPDLTLVLIQVIHIKYHRTPEIAVVKHGRRIICDHQITDDIQVIDIIHLRHIDHTWYIRGHILKPNLMMGAEQQDIFVPQLLHKSLEVQLRIVLESLSLFKLVIPPGRRIQHHFFACWHADLLFDARHILFGKFKQSIVSRITGL